MALRALLIIASVVSVSAFDDFRMPAHEFEELHRRAMNGEHLLDLLETYTEKSLNQEEETMFLQGDWESNDNSDELEEVRFWEQMEPERSEQRSNEQKEHNRHKRFDSNYIRIADAKRHHENRGFLEF